MSEPTPIRTPLFEAEHSPRYERQRLIREYQREYKCRLVVLIGRIVPECVTRLEETLYDANLGEDLHLLLATLGGDGETALRLIRQAQSRCRELTVIVPDQAKSAGTLLCIGADHIIMGPTSDLGPIDPQLIVTGKRPIYVPARDIIAAVKAAEKRIKANPAIFPLYASLFEDISVVHLAAARSAVARVDDQLTEAIKSVTSRDCGAAESLEAKLKGPLVKNPTSHSTTIPASVAQKELGLPVRILASSSCQWQHIWGLWTRYLVILGKQGIASPMQIYEGQTASRIE